MNVKRVFTALLFSSLALSAFPAGAVSAHSNWVALRYNTAGSSFITTSAPSNTTFCFLKSVSIEETDTGGEEATCRLNRGATWWTLEAILDASNDADAECEAYCYNN